MCDNCGCSHDHEHTLIVLPVKGMMCQICADSIDKALNALPGVHARADFANNVVALSLHEEADMQTIKNTILDLGFEL